VTDYLARLKDRLRQAPPQSPNRHTLKTFNRSTSGAGVGFEGFEGASGACVSRAGVPRLWVDELAQMDRGVAPRDVPPQRWAVFLDDWALFLDGEWAGKAAELGWQAHDLFGCDPHKPFARLSRQGLLWLIKGGELVEMDCNSATFRTLKTFNRLTYRRAPTDSTSVNAWDLQNLQNLQSTNKQTNTIS
jgi:hypothetical protein